MSYARYMLVVSLVLAHGWSAAGAAYLEYRSAVIAAGDTGPISVVLHTEGEQIAGVQNDTVLPTGLHLTGDGGGCHPNLATGKEATVFRLLRSTPNGEQLRAIVISLRNVDPIADGALLYSCDIAVDPDAAAGVHRIEGINLAASDPSGRSLPLHARGGTVTVPSGGRPAASAPGTGPRAAPHGAAGPLGWPLPGPSPRTAGRPQSAPVPARPTSAHRSMSTPVWTPPTPTPTTTPDAAALAQQAGAEPLAQSGSGCQIASDSHQSCWPGLVAALALSLVRARRRRRCPLSVQSM